MGLLDYYRQFDDVDPEEVNRGLRERRARERALALEQVPLIDLSRTEWPHLPHSEAVNGAIAAARGPVNRYPDPHADAVRTLLAERHGVAPEQVALGNGACALLQAAVQVLAGRGDELVTPWPSYPLFPLIARNAGAQPIAAPLRAGAVDPEAILASITPRTRAVVLANPNDPTGTYLDSQALRELLAALPEGVRLLLDEAYIQCQDVEPEDACLALVAEFPQLVAFRTFSKIYGLAGLRIGYAVGAPDAGELLAATVPALGVNALCQAAASAALQLGEVEIARRREAVLAGRRLVLDALHELPFDAPPSQASFIWVRAADKTGAQLAAALERSGVIVAPGGQLGDDEHVRASVHGPEAADRLLGALENAV